MCTVLFVPVSEIAPPAEALIVNPTSHDPMARIPVAAALVPVEVPTSVIAVPEVAAESS